MQKQYDISVTWEKHYNNTTSLNPLDRLGALGVLTKNLASPGKPKRTHLKLIQYLSFFFLMTTCKKSQQQRPVDIVHEKIQQSDWLEIKKQIVWNHLHFA